MAENSGGCCGCNPEQWSCFGRSGDQEAKQDKAEKTGSNCWDRFCGSGPEQRSGCCG
jgi:hypothetical protein